MTTQIMVEYLVNTYPRTTEAVFSTRREALACAAAQFDSADVESATIFEHRPSEGLYRRNYILYRETDNCGRISLHRTGE